MDKQNLWEKLNRSLDDLELSVRQYYALHDVAGCSFIGDVVQKSKKELLAIKNFGKQSLHALEEILNYQNLSFGMDVMGWKPPVEQKVPDISYKKLERHCAQWCENVAVNALTALYVPSTSRRITSADGRRSVIVAIDNSISRPERSQFPIVGVACLLMLDYLGGLRGRIAELIVHPSYRDQGIEKEFLLRLIQEARDLSITKLEFIAGDEFDELAHIYQSLCFQPSERRVYELVL